MECMYNISHFPFFLNVADIYNPKQRNGAMMSIGSNHVV